MSKTAAKLLGLPQTLCSVRGIEIVPRRFTYLFFRRKGTSRTRKLNKARLEDAVRNSCVVIVNVRSRNPWRQKECSCAKSAQSNYADDAKHCAVVDRWRRKRKEQIMKGRNRAESSQRRFVQEYNMQMFVFRVILTKRKKERCT